MDNGERMAKVETIVDEHGEQFKRFEHEFARIHDSIAALREHTDRGLAELREHTDKGLAELREHIDKGLAELRLHTDNSFAAQRGSFDQSVREIRQDLQKTTRWLVGMAFVYGIVIVGMIGRMGGLY